MRTVNEIVAERLLKIRKIKNAKLKEIEEKTGIKSQTLSAYERGRKTPNITNLRKIADCYGVNINYFVYDGVFNHQPLSNISKIINFLEFVKATKTIITFNYLNEIILNVNENELVNVLKKLNINKWIKNGFAKNTSNDEHLSNLIMESMIEDKVFSIK